MRLSFIGHNVYPAVLVPQFLLPTATWVFIEVRDHSYRIEWLNHDVLKTGVVSSCAAKFALRVTAAVLQFTVVVAK